MRERCRRCGGNLFVTSEEVTCLQCGDITYLDQPAVDYTQLRAALEKPRRPPPPPPKPRRVNPILRDMRSIQWRVAWSE